MRMMVRMRLGFIAVADGSSLHKPFIRMTGSVRMSEAYDEALERSRSAVASMGCVQLTTPEAVDSWFEGHSGFSIVFFNSLCGCVGASARPALAQVLEEESCEVVTVFAGVDREATQRMRERFSFPPSSPSFLFVRDGVGLELFERERIVGRQPDDVARELLESVRSLKSDQ